MNNINLPDIRKQRVRYQREINLQRDATLWDIASHLKDNETFSVRKELGPTIYLDYMVLVIFGEREENESEYNERVGIKK